jgi:hypothetical protein
MVDGNPDPKLFKAGVRALIEQVSRDERTERTERCVFLVKW